MNLFESWDRLISTAVSAGLFFVIVVVIIRLAGKRTTANMNNFDWIVAVAIGSLASSGILLKNVPIADATIAIVVLVALQWLTTWMTIRSPWFSSLIKPAPRMLTHKGQYLRNAMIKERVTQAEIDATLREAGYVSPEDANWVIIETNGILTVIPRQDASLDESDLLSGVSVESMKADDERS